MDKKLLSASAPIDLEHLERQTLGDPEVRREVLDIFARDWRSLRLQLESSSGAERSLLAHRLKGAAHGIGAHRVAECAIHLEIDPVRADIAELFEACEE